MPQWCDKHQQHTIDEVCSGCERETPEARLEHIIVSLIQHIRARCGSGFGQYPIGVRYAIGELLPLIPHLDSQTQEQLRDLDERLSR